MPYMYIIIETKSIAIGTALKREILSFSDKNHEESFSNSLDKS